MSSDANAGSLSTRTQMSKSRGPNTVGGGDNFTDQEIHYQFPQMLCPVLSNPMDCSPPGSSVHGILQARILLWVAIPFSRGSSQHRD